MWSLWICIVVAFAGNLVVQATRLGSKGSPAQTLLQHAPKAPLPTVDLVVTAHLPNDEELLVAHLASIDTFWKPFVKGTIHLLCVDCGGNSPSLARLLQAKLPHGTTRDLAVHNVEGPSCLHPFLRHQWSNFEAVSFVKAPYVAFTDSDGLFHSPVRYEQLMTPEGKPIVLSRMGDFALGGTASLLKMASQLNYMVALPFVMRTSTLERLRDYTVWAHQPQPAGVALLERSSRSTYDTEEDKGARWNAIWCKAFEHSRPQQSAQEESSWGLLTLPCNFCIMGAYIENAAPSEYKMIVEDDPKGAPAVMRMASHIRMDWSLQAPCAGGDPLANVWEAHKPAPFSVGWQSMKHVFIKQRTADLAIAECYAPSAPASCQLADSVFAVHVKDTWSPPPPRSSRPKCSNVFHPLILWQGATCWGVRQGSLGQGSHGPSPVHAAAKATGVSAYLRQIGQDVAFEACSRSQETLPTDCTCGELKQLVVEVGKIITGQQSRDWMHDQGLADAAIARHNGNTAAGTKAA